MSTTDVQMKNTQYVNGTYQDQFVVDVEPRDEHNAQLVSNVHPADWQNPRPAERYNLVVIGAGTGGLVTAIIGAGVGAKVALVEKNLLGGDCLNVGCVPSKAIIRSAHTVGEIRRSHEFGVNVPPGVEVDFGRVMERMRQVRARISHGDSVKRFSEAGIDIFLGEGHFTGPNSLDVGGQTLNFSRAVIATGARAAQPPIPGLADAGYLTNETVFSLTERPERIAIIGAGPIGAEMAQAFRRLGSEVVLFHDSAHILNREDADAAEIVQQAFIREGIQLVLNGKITQVITRDGKKVLQYEQPDGSSEIAVDEILVGAGRVPNVDTLNLEAAGVHYDMRKGVEVDDRLRTSNNNIFAVGDVALKYKFTHMADATARIVIRNALFKGRQKVSDLVLPWVTYTDPEIAHVGMYEHEAQAQGIAIDTFVQELSEVDRAITDGEDTGFVKVHVKKGSDKIVGATIVARNAGEMINEFTLAMVAGVGMSTLANVIHPYPTQSEAVRKVANAYTRTRFTPTLQKLFKWWIKLTA
jgi:pyruvate/2-oxoglutarate dehydrogenase complex dihydrolipoamide dehydrogenase (E3) component